MGCKPFEWNADGARATVSGVCGEHEFKDSGLKMGSRNLSDTVIMNVVVAI